jgi:hypothetical protein
MIGARALAISFTSMTLLGCYATWGPDPVYVTSGSIGYVPYDYYNYPYVYYGGHPTYWINNHWYWHDSGVWHYYPTEPPALYRQRPYVQQAPPAPHYYSPAPVGRSPFQPATPVPSAPVFRPPYQQTAPFQHSAPFRPVQPAPTFRAPPVAPQAPMVHPPPVFHAPPAAPRVR